jgi:hypothetical protein
MEVEQGDLWDYVAASTQGEARWQQQEQLATLPATLLIIPPLCRSCAKTKESPAAARARTATAATADAEKTVGQPAAALLR